MGGLVPASSASGAVGSRWSCGHRTVRVDSSVYDHLRSAVRMLLQPSRKQPGEEAEEEHCDLDT